jgi:hypothetical protein
MSGAPLDRIRRKAGVVGHAPSTSLGPAGHAVHHHWGGLDAILAARRGRPVDVREFRLPAGIAAALGLATIFGHVRALEWSAHTATHEDLFVYRWLVNVLTVWDAQAWAPVLATVAVIGLAACGVWTNGFRDGHLPAVVALGVSLVAAGVASLPLLAAAVIALLALVVAIALFIAVVVGCLLILYGALASSLE